MSKPIEIVMNDELEKLLAAATPGPWTHASDKLAAGNIKAPDNAALIVAAVNALPELLAMVKRLEEALTFYAARENYNDEPLPNNMWKTAKAVFDGGKRARAALEQTP
jgi:cell division protein ZapA (FtsZ GTPase activity inhibitor)